MNATSSSSFSFLTPLDASGFTVEAQTASCSFVGSLTFLLYDILLTVDQEVELLRQRTWSLFKFLYIYVRYAPFFLQIPLLLVGTEITPRFQFTKHDCYLWEIYQGILLIAVMAPVDYILVARIYALYHTQVVVQILVSVAYITAIIFMSIGLGLSLPSSKYDGICHTVDVPSTFLFYGGAEVAFQTLLFLLTTYKFIKSLRKNGWNSTVRGVPITIMIVRDGTWAFFVLFGVVIAQALAYLADGDGGILYSWVLSSFSFCGYRILLNFTRIPRSRPATTTASQSILTTIVSQWSEYISPVPFEEWEAGSNVRDNGDRYYNEHSAENNA